jgi:hypothetical protein
MFFYGVQYALLESCIVRYSMKLKLFMDVHGDHHSYTFDRPSWLIDVYVTAL